MHNVGRYRNVRPVDQDPCRVADSACVHPALTLLYMQTGSRQDKSEAKCQRCLQKGHWSYECKNPRVYLARESKTEKLRQQHKVPPFDTRSWVP